jgi:hypothetical protein
LIWIIGLELFQLAKFKNELKMWIGRFRWCEIRITTNFAICITTFRTTPEYHRLWICIYPYWDPFCCVILFFNFEFSLPKVILNFRKPRIKLKLLQTLNQKKKQFLFYKSIFILILIFITHYHSFWIHCIQKNI